MTTPSIPPGDGSADANGHDAPTGPIPVIATPEASGPHPSSRSRTPILLAVIGVLVVALGVVTALWVSASNQLSAIESAKARKA